MEPTPTPPPAQMQPAPGSYAARFSAYLTSQLAALLGSLGFTQRQNVPSDLWPHLEGMAANRAHHDARYGGTSWHQPGGAYFASNAHKRAKLRARTGRR